MNTEDRLYKKKIKRKFQITLLTIVFLMNAHAWSFRACSTGHQQSSTRKTFIFWNWNINAKFVYKWDYNKSNVVILKLLYNMIILSSIPKCYWYFCKFNSILYSFKFSCVIKVVSFAIFISAMCELLPVKHEGQLCSFMQFLLFLFGAMLEFSTTPFCMLVHGSEVA